MSETRSIVRLAGRDLDGNRKIVAALEDVAGVGHTLAYAVLNHLKIGSNLRLGQLSEGQISAIERVLRNPASAGLPPWLFNRRKDPETGKDSHLLESDMEFAIRMDIEREKRAGSWRGVRHALGLKVRGQKTRTTGRRGKTIGVRKRAAVPGGQQPQQSQS
ncbi:30S ribosomal protein S13 [Conexivisphaera calida]|uniref:Small ribosomal subunit protein uS13 n=1 Tax=Conexivisphaera calida TaxID=1874277 RepID=A0A4P2VEA6_9ARCH|nr:30S ribosomal protein S13 [Conexivisphaera calida]BBE41733.1 SSU ribosomal protein S18e [Conexivisphaera calida]